MVLYIFIFFNLSNAYSSPKKAFAVDDWGDTELAPSAEAMAFEKQYRYVAKKLFILEKNNITSDQTAVLYQSFQDFPQSIFMFKNGSSIIVGKKYQSDACFTDKLPGVFCSRIQAPMILGAFTREQITQDGIFVYYNPISYSEKNTLFTTLVKDRNIDIYYPYTQLLSEAKLEKTSPKDGWKFEKDRGSSLGIGEQELRKYTITFLKTVNTKSKKVFDPACSTGEFLANIKAHFPNVTTIGQDLSPSMVEEAKQRVDKVYVGDSISSPVKKNSMDFIFFRFLNSEVVTTEQAYGLLNALSTKCKNGGYIIIFGHSPVLISSEVLTQMGFIRVQLNGVSEDKKSVFQYYIFKKSSNTKPINYKDLQSNHWAHI